MNLYNIFRIYFHKKYRVTSLLLLLIGFFSLYTRVLALHMKLVITPVKACPNNSLFSAQARQPGLLGIMNSLDALQRSLVPWGVREFGCLTRTV